MAFVVEFVAPHPTLAACLCAVESQVASKWLGLWVLLEAWAKDGLQLALRHGLLLHGRLLFWLLLLLWLPGGLRGRLLHGGLGDHGLLRLGPVLGRHGGCLQGHAIYV